MSTIIFDFDGTLVDTRATYVEMMHVAFEKESIEISEEDISANLVPSISTTIELLLDGMDKNDEKLVKKLENSVIALLSSGWMDHIGLNKNIKSLLDSLYDEGHELYLVSNSHSSFVLPALAKFGLGKYFREVLTLDSDYNDKVDMILGLAVKIGELVIDITYIADTLMDVEFADEVGCKFLLLITPSSWDFNRRSELVRSVIGKPKMRVVDGVQNAIKALTTETIV